VNDRLSDPRIRFASDVPEYDDTQILQIMLGQDPRDSEEAGVSPEQQAAGAVGNVILGRVLVGYRPRKTGEENKNANEGTIEWRLQRNIVVEGFYGDNDVGAADIVYIIRY
jgi:hypothetical protein